MAEQEHRNTGKCGPNGFQKLVQIAEEEIEIANIPALAGRLAVAALVVGGNRVPVGGQRLGERDVPSGMVRVPVYKDDHGAWRPVCRHPAVLDQTHAVASRKRHRFLFRSQHLRNVTQGFGKIKR